MDINSLLSGSIGQQIIGVAAKKLGINEDQAQNAVSTAVPVLLSALNKNAQNGEAEAISDALENHNGGFLNNIASIFGQSNDQKDGSAILSHILGDKQESVESAISQNSGLSTSQVSQILVLLAPIIMSFLAKQKKTENLDAKGITSLLGGLMKGTNSSEGRSFEGFEKLLDKNGDGKVGASDIIETIGGLFKKK